MSYVIECGSFCQDILHQVLHFHVSLLACLGLYNLSFHSCWFPGWSSTNTLTQKWQNLCLLGNKKSVAIGKTWWRQAGKNLNSWAALHLLPHCRHPFPSTARRRLGCLSLLVSISQHSLHVPSPKPAYTQVEAKSGHLWEIGHHLSSAHMNTSYCSLHQDSGNSRRSKVEGILDPKEKAGSR